MRAGDIFTVARQAGYRTALIGKNHTYLTEHDVDRFVEFSHGGQRSGPRSDEEAGFDEWLNGLSHRTAVEPAPGGVAVQNPHRIVSHAATWIDSLGPDEPFVLEVSFPEPHNPYQAPEPYFDLFPPDVVPPNVVGEEFLDTASDEMRYLRRIGLKGDPEYVNNMPRARSNYLGMLRFIDDEMKRLVDHVRGVGRMDNTIVLVTSDHGDYFGEYGLMRKGVGMSDVLMRVPLVAYGPAVAARGASESFASLADILPTVCDYLEHPVPDRVQGRTLRPILAGDASSSAYTSAYGEQGIGGSRLPIAELPEDSLPGLPGPDATPGSPTFDELNAVTQAGRTRMVRAGKWKLICDASGEVQLFDVVEDPSEIRNLAAGDGAPPILHDLLVLLARWSMHVEDETPLPRDGYARTRQQPVEAPAALRGS